MSATAYGIHTCTPAGHEGCTRLRNGALLSYDDVGAYHAATSSSAGNCICVYGVQDEDLQLLNWESAGGFASLNRSKLLWHIILSHNRHRTDQTDYLKQVARSITIAWDELLGKELGPLPAELHVNGGGQFMVQRDSMLRHSKSFYQECLAWLADSLTLSPWDKGMVFEYTWKVIFGEPPEQLDRNVWDAN